MSFTQTEKNIIMRVGRHPDGPTLHFVVRKFMPPRVVKASQKHPFESEAACKPVLCIMLRIIETFLFSSYIAGTSTQQLQPIRRTTHQTHESYLSTHVPYNQCQYSQTW